MNDRDRTRVPDEGADAVALSRGWGEVPPDDPRATFVEARRGRASLLRRAAMVPPLRLLTPHRRVHARLAALRALEGVDAPAHLPQTDVDAAEAALGVVFDDSTLALFAADLELLHDDYAMDLGRVVAHTHEARAQGCPAELTALGYHHATETYVCGALGGAAAAGEPSISFFSEDASSADEPVALSAWLDTLLDAKARDVGDAHEREDNGEEDAEGAPSTRRASAAFAPALVAPRDAPPAPLRRVRHKAFGLGDVVRIIADGPLLKLEIAFAAVGRKTMLASAVEDAHAPTET